MKLVSSKGAVFLATLAAASWLLFSLNIVRAADEVGTASSTIAEQTTTSSSTTSTIINTSVIPTSTVQTTTSSPTSTSSNSDSSTSTTSTWPVINFYLRYQNNFIVQGEIALTTSTDIIYHQSTTNTLATTTLTQPTVLSALITANQQSQAFSVSDLVYYTDWGGSYYVNCLQIATTSACYNWQYIVDNQYPTVGMDKYNLTGGETVYVYFGTPWKITASSSTFPANAATTLTTWRYNYDNLTDDWVIDPNNLIDISINNPSSTGWFDSTMTVATTTSESDGTANYIFTATGTYYAKITSADWSKWSDPITLTVIDVAASTTASSTRLSENPGQTSSNSSNNDQFTINNEQIQQAVDKIINYLKSQQSDDGKILDAGISDWLAMSFMVAGLDPVKIKTGDKSLLDYILSYIPSQANELNQCAAYPRHLLALYAAGVPKTNKAMLDLRDKIKNECYQQGDFGQQGINDDIFGLISLLAVGENTDQPIIQDLVTDITADQQADGSFTWDGWPGADITGGAINALKYANNKGANMDKDIISRAKNYLKSNQLTDGGWTNYGSSADILTTSWVMMGINAMGEKQADWLKNNTSPWHVLINNLTGQGYYQSAWEAGAIDWFALKHSIPALLGYSWPIEPRFNQSSLTEQSTGQPENQTGSGFDNSSSTTVTMITTSTTITTTTSKNPLSTEIVNQASSIEPITTPSAPLTIQVSNIKPATTNFPQEKITPINPVSQPQLATATTESSKSSNQNQTAELIIEESPLDTPTRRAAKKALTVSGSSALALGLYLGFKLLKYLI